MKRSGQVECETCANREYKDGSDEVNVSFKSAAHIDPSAAATKVMAHEQEHVSNANRKAASKDGEVLNATVTLKNGCLSRVRKVVCVRWCHQYSN